MATIDRYRVLFDTEQANRSIDGLRGAVAGLIAAFSVRELVQFADSITNVRNRLNQLTPDINDTTEQFRALAGIAINARAPLSETADLYFRISRAAGSLGITQREAAEVTGLVAKAITASGISAQEAQGPLLQLGQALQSGRLQGDELKSILEGLPPVANALATSLGVPIGALKELGAQGKISAQDVIQAIRDARDSIERDFGATTATIGQASEVLRTSLALTFDNFEQNTQAGQSVAVVIEYIAMQIFRLSNNVDKIIGPLSTFVKIVGSIAAFTIVGRVLRTVGGILVGLTRGVGSASAMFRNFLDNLRNFGTIFRQVGGGLLGFVETVIFTLTPLGRLLRLIGAIGAAAAAYFGLDELFGDIEELGDKSSDTSNEIAAWKEEMAALALELDNTKDSGNAVNNTLTELQDTVSKGLGDYKSSNADFLENLKITRENLNLTREQIQYNDDIRRFTENYRDRVKDLREELKELNKNPERNAELIAEINQAIADTTSEYQEQLPQVTKIAAEIKKISEDQSAAEESARKQTEALRESAEAARLLQRVTEGVDDYIVDIRRSSENAQRELERMNMNSLERELDDIEQQLQRGLQDKIREINRTEIDPVVKDEKIRKITEETNKAVEAQKQAAREAYEYSRSFEFGWKRAYEQYAEDATNAAKQAENIFKTATQGMEDALVDLITTGKFEWRDFVNELGEMLLRAELKRLIADVFGAISPSGSGGSILGGLFGGGPASSSGSSGGSGSGGGLLGTVGSIVGGVVSGIGSFFGGLFANGGTLPGGQFGIVGEAGPELITGPANITPLQGLGSTTNVTYNISAVDAASFRSLVARDPEFIHAVAMKGGSSVPMRR